MSVPFAALYLNTLGLLLRGLTLLLMELQGLWMMLLMLQKGCQKKTATATNVYVLLATYFSQLLGFCCCWGVVCCFWLIFLALLLLLLEVTLVTVETDAAASRM